MIKKKGDISIQVLVLAIIALIVLVVIIMIFTSQATKRTKDYEDIATGALKSRCESMFGKNVCAEKNPDPKRYTAATAPSGGWPFCETTCWEPIK